MSDKAGKESQYMFSHPELGSDPPIGSDWESGCDNTYHHISMLCFSYHIIYHIHVICIFLSFVFMFHACIYLRSG